MSYVHFTDLRTSTASAKLRKPVLNFPKASAAKIFLSILNSQQDLKLKRLTIGSNITLYRDEEGQRREYPNMIYANQDYFARAVVRLEEVNLRSTNLQSHQILQVCQAIVTLETDQLRLRKLNLSHNGPVGLEADNYCIKAKEKLRALEAHHFI